MKRIKTKTCADMYKRLRRNKVGLSAAARGRQIAVHGMRSGTVAPEPMFAIPQHKTLRHHFTIDDVISQRQLA